MKSAPFHSKTSLTPQSAELFNNTPTSPIHALNFSTATPSQMSTMLSNIHITGEFKALDKSKPPQSQPSVTSSGVYTMSPPPTTGCPVKPIIKVKMETEVINRLGMEDSFNNSPMARLIKEYSGKADDLEAAGIPMKTNVGLVLGVSKLSAHMIVDRGPDGDQRLPRYHLTALHLDRITTVVTEQQIFLE